jgi:predicted site-specific integrase-resolvase
MDAWGHQLKVDALFTAFALEGSRCFVVKLWQLWPESLINEILVQFVVRSEVFGVRAIFHSICQNGVTIVIINYK